MGAPDSSNKGNPHSLESQLLGTSCSFSSLKMERTEGGKSKNVGHSLDLALFIIILLGKVG